VALAVILQRPNETVTQFSRVFMGGGKKKKDGGSGGAGAAQDPKSAALAHLGISMGSKNMRNIKKEEIDGAFIQKLHDSEYT
jgi:hypothetical protein